MKITLQNKLSNESDPSIKENLLLIPRKYELLVCTDQGKELASLRIEPQVHGDDGTVTGFFLSFNVLESKGVDVLDKDIISVAYDK